VSDLDPWSLVELDDAEWLKQARLMIQAGESGALSEFLLEELARDTSWRRDRVMRLLPELELADALISHFALALHDDDQADRRNGARSGLAALARTGSGVCEEALAELSELTLHSEDADVRLLAAAALGEAGNARAREALQSALNDPDANVGSAAAEALGLLGDRRSVRPLMALLERGEFWTRAAAIVALGRLGDPRALQGLAAVIHDPQLASAAAAAIGEIGDPGGLAILRKALEAEGEPRGAALDAVARIFGHAPLIEVPDWLRSAVARSEGELIAQFRSDPGAEVARLLAIAGTDAASDALLAGAADPDLQATAAAALESLPVELRTTAVLRRLNDVPHGIRARLLGLLPPLDDPAAIDTVVEQLAADDPEARAAAAEVLGRSRVQLVMDALERRIGRPEMRLGVALALGRLGTERCEPLVGLLRDEDPEVRAAAAEALGRCGRTDVGAVQDALRAEPESQVRQALLLTLGSLGGPEVVPDLEEGLLDARPGIRFAAVRALGRTGAADALGPLLAALEDPLREIRIAGLEALGELGDAAVADVLHEHLSEPSREVRRTAAAALKRLAPAGSVERVAKLLSDTDRQVRRTALETLRRIGGDEAVRALEAHLDVEGDVGVRSTASRLLIELRADEEPGSV
jgi:HEAT repeat protein